MGSLTYAIAVVAGGSAALLGTGAWWQATAARRDRRRFPPPGRMVDVDGHRLHIRRSTSRLRPPACPP